MQATYAGADARLQYLFQNAKNVSATPILSSGTKIGTITIDGTGVDLYAPSSSGGVSCQPLTNEGTAVAIFTIGNRDYIIYCPVSSEVEFHGLLESHTEVIEQSQSQIEILYDEDNYKIGTLTIQNGDEYRLTTDTTVHLGKTYYSRTDVYSSVTPSAGDNPVALGWYEFVGGAYVRTTDTSVVSGKTYYALTSTYSAVTPESGDNPSEEGWYELSMSSFPIYSPPAIGVTYQSNLNSGYNVGTLIVRTVTNDPTHEDTAAVTKEETFDIIVPTGSGGSIVSYTQILQSGTHIGTISIDGTSTNIYAPSGGGTGDVADVYVNGSSVLDANKIAQIDLTGYATDNELASAVATLQANFQAGVDSIYNACVRKGSTPASHSLADVVDAIYAIGGNVDYRNVESTMTMNMRYFGHAKEEE